MPNYLVLNQNYVQCGLGTLTYIVPATLPPNNIAISNIPFSVQCQVTVPQRVAEGAGSGSGADQGLGVTGTSPAYLPSYQTTGAQQGLGNGALGLGFQNVATGTFGGFDAGGSGGIVGGGSINDNASGSGSGYGAGAGGGTLGGFAEGGGGLGAGATGDGFGPSNSGYPQPPTDVRTPTSFAGVLSSLSVVVNQNGTPVYTSFPFNGNNSQYEFKAPLLVNAGDTITVVFSSSNAADSVPLNVIKANLAIQVGE